MRAPLVWLREYCSPDLDTARVAQRLTMTGTKVEAIARHGVRTPEKFVVGHVLDAARHPDADRLSVCSVDVGEGRPAQIVCGAPNVAAGQTVAVARPGAVMPDGTTLGKVRLRGVESEGMILAEDELAIGTEHDGILVLDHGELLAGTPLEEVLPIATDVLELEITSNRPDCLGIYGVARELHAATGAPLKAPPWAEDPGTPGDVRGVDVEVLATEDCYRFTARAFEQVMIGPSPPWLKARLMACGQRPISNVVDITNYVMLLTGQPLHAFDLERIAGGRLLVRRARDREQVQTLDGQTRTLDERMVVIEDAEGPTSIAGVMGGARSEVGPGTTRVLMEIATWDGPSIHRTAWRLGLQSEASLRFEKQLQPEQAIEAQALATRLMVELCGAHLASGTIDVGGEGPPPVTIRLREERVQSLLGAPISRESCAQILAALEFETAAADDGLDVRPPAFRRADITREADVIEEVARLDGLEKLPASLPSRHGAAGRLTARQKLRRKAADTLAAQGLHEVVGWSFAAPDLAHKLKLEGEVRALELVNPMSSEHSTLRTTLLGSLLDVAAYNHARGATTLRLFEAGTVFLRTEGEGLPREPYHLAGLLTGSTRPPTWREPRPPAADFFAVKGIVEGSLRALHASYSLERSNEPFLHPGRRAQVVIAERGVGWIGELHPLVVAHWGLVGTVAAFELDLDAVPEPSPIVYEDLLSFPEIREDIAVVVGDEVSAAQVRATIMAAGAPLLHAAEVFDVYRDPERLGEGQVSLALALRYRAVDRTLTDEEVAAKRAAITQALERELGGRVRAA